MTKDFNISRRKTLAALGTIGVASAGAGLGTSAYFSDQETFENNQLTAGTLDLKVDWEEHYSDWSADEGEGLDITMDAPNDPENYTAFPPGVGAFDGDSDNDFINGDPLLYVHNEDVSQFMDNTSVEAYPDTGAGDGTADDGVQDPIPDSATGACEYLADVGNDDDGLDPNGPRSNNADTVDADGNTLPLINLNDVKPGDFGELTLSLHLCTNPGYVWLNADNVDAQENGLTEPEADDPDEGDGVELLDEIQTAWWYDANGDNLVTGGTGGGTSESVDVAIVLDESGSMSNGDVDATRDAARAFVDELVSGDAAASVAFASSADVRQSITTDLEAVKDAIGDQNMDSSFSPPRTSGSTDVTEALNAAQDDLVNNGRADANNIIVLLSDGGPNSVSGALTAADDAKSAGTRIITLGFGLSEGSSAENFMKAAAGTTPNSLSDYNDGSPYDDEGDYYLAPGPGEVEEIFTNIGRGIREGDQVFFQGTLREALELLTDGNGYPLDGSPSSEGRGCFPGETTSYIGFSWWLPTDHGNEVQSDSVSFDLGFYTEQCRHNDGSGMNNENVDPDEVDA
jgi:predicted ribosomally synthesized peptide with SipW-like signal peptide